MNSHNHSSSAKAGAAVLIALCLYIGLYAWLCFPDYDSMGWHPYGVPNAIEMHPVYKYGGRLSQIIFWPAWKLDTLLFPNRWKPIYIPA